jgi:hypothetical protein
MLGRVITVSIFLFFIFYSIAFAYDDNFVHPEINEHASLQSSLDNYFKDNLGYSDGIKTIFNNREVFRWLRQGGTDEDYLTRLLRHFHDPLEPWADAGILELDSI